MQKQEVNSSQESRLFIGREVEGPEAGSKTLFIPNQAENRKDFLSVAEEHNINRLYFGAGNDRGIADDIIDELYNIPVDWDVVLEIDNFDQLKNLPYDFIYQTEIVFVVDYGKPFDVNVFKVVSNSMVHWYELSSPSCNSLTDPMYDEDFKV